MSCIGRRDVQFQVGWALPTLPELHQLKIAKDAAITVSKD